MRDDIELLLERWGELARGGVTAGLGYPSASVEHRAIWGIGGRPVLPEWPSDVQAVERAMCRLPDTSRDALRLIYVARLSYRLGAKLCRVSLPTFRSRVDGARMFVSG